MLNSTRLVAIAFATCALSTFANAQELRDLGVVHGPVSPSAMAERREESARGMSTSHPDSTIARFVQFDIAWPGEQEDTGGYAIVLIDAQSHSSDELPIRRVYLRPSDGSEIELRRVGAQRFSIPIESVAHSVFGPFQESSFYWAPLDALAAPGEVFVDFAVNRTGFRAMQLPAEPPPWYEGEAHGAPNAEALAALLAREYAGFEPQ